MDVEGAHPPAQQQAPAHNDVVGSGAAASATKHGAFIPAASYKMPAPTWRVKPQFASWEVDHTRFEIKRLLGKGSYGSVAEAIDHLTNQRVAIKRIPGVFEVRRGSATSYAGRTCLRTVTCRCCHTCSDVDAAFFAPSRFLRMPNASSAKSEFLGYWTTPIS